MPFRVDLQSVEPAKRRAITTQSRVDEFLLRAAQDSDGDLWDAQFTEEVSERMQNDGGHLQLRRQLGDLRASALSNQIRSTFVSPLDAGKDDQRLVNPSDRVLILLVDFRATLGGDRAAEAIHVQDQ